MDGGWINGCGNIHKSQMRFSRGQVELANVSHQRKARVIDREGQIGLIRQGSGGDSL